MYTAKHTTTRGVEQCAYISQCNALRPLISADPRLVRLCMGWGTSANIDLHGYSAPTNVDVPDRKYL